MNPVDNPYSPGAGSRPPELAGREQEIQDVDILLKRLVTGKHSRSLLIRGLRGVGKTVLLNEFEQMAQRAGWYPAFREISTDQTSFRKVATEMSRRVVLAMSAEARLKETANRVLRVIKSFGLKAKVKDQGGMEWSIGIEPIAGLADSGDLKEDFADVLVELGQLAKGHETGVVLLFDEVQNLSGDDLSGLIVALHRVNQKNLPVTVVAAGLPQLAKLAAEAQSYAERLFKFVEIGALADTAGRRALEVPAGRSGVSFEPVALDAIMDKSQGYPYFVQEWGEKVWNTAPGPVVSGADVAKATVLVEEALDNGFFFVRAERATPGELKYMQAMAALGAGPYKSADVLRLLGGKTHADMGPVRDSLIKKGLVYSPTYAHIAFTVPQFEYFMRRKHPNFEQANRTKPRKHSTN